MQLVFQQPVRVVARNDQESSWSVMASAGFLMAFPPNAQPTSAGGSGQDCRRQWHAGSCEVPFLTTRPLHVDCGAQ